MKTIIFTIFIVLAVSYIAIADGSVDFDRTIIPILNTRPEFARFVKSKLRMIGNPLGMRIDSRAIPALGGARTGPYRVKAVWVDNGIEVPITLIINTRIRYYDKSNHEITSSFLRQAVRLDESIDSIEIDPP